MTIEEKEDIKEIALPREEAQEIIALVLREVEKIRVHLHHAIYNGTPEEFLYEAKKFLALATFICRIRIYDPEVKE